MKKIISSGLFILLLFTLAGCQKQAEVKYERDFFALDTYITCQVLSSDEKLAKQALDEVEAAFMQIDGISNRFAQNAEISKVNQSAGIAPIKVSDDLMAMVTVALDWSDKTGGAFNILLGTVMDLWGFGSSHPAVPDEQTLKTALRTSDWHKIVLNPELSTIYLPEKGMVMDLGGVAKGYATDKAVAVLKKIGIKNALINAGGNVYAWGNRLDGTPWIIGVRDPRNPQKIAALLQGRDTSFITSGDDQRYFEKDGIRYHHIINPADGYPARLSSSTTIISPSATIADILSTALFVNGPQAGIELAETFKEVEAAMIIDAKGEKTATRSWIQYLTEQQTLP